MSYHHGGSAPRGDLGLRVIRASRNRWIDECPWPTAPLTIDAVLEHGLSHDGLPDVVNAWRRANRRTLVRGLWKIFAARRLHLPHAYGQVYLSIIHADGQRVDLGLASTRVVTTAGVRYICDDMNAGAGSADVSLFKFHGLGTGATAEAAADTALQTELTTQYNPDSTRATGSQASATVSANATYTTVGTNTVDAAAAVTEHGILTQAATGGGTLLDRSVFSVVNLASGDSLQTTYVLTINSGG